MALGSNLYKLTFQSNARNVITPTRLEMTLLRQITEDSLSPAEKYQASLDRLNDLFGKTSMSGKEYKAALARLDAEQPDAIAKQEELNRSIAHGEQVMRSMVTPTQQYIDALVMNKKAAAAMGWSQDQLNRANELARQKLPEVAAAERARTAELARAKQIIQANLTPLERYKQSIRELPRVLLQTRVGQEAWRREVVRLRNELQTTQPAVKGFFSSLSLSRITSSIGALTGVAVGVGGIGMAARSAFRGYSEFATGMAHSTAIMGDLSSETLERMRSTARDVSFDVEASAAQAAEGYFYLASAGLSAEESIGALPRTARFAQAGAFDLALATDLLTDAQSALGMNIGTTAEKMEAMDRVSDVLTKANVLANASIEQFSKSLTNKAGPSLKAANKDIEEGVAVLAAFADQGIKDEEAGTALAIVMRDLQTKAIDNADAFREQGIAVFDSTGKMNNLGEIIRNMERQFDGLSVKAKKQILMDLGFSDKSVVFTQALLGTGDKIAEYERKLRDAKGTTDEVAGKSMPEMTKVLNTLRAGFDEFAGIVLPELGKGFMGVDGESLEDTIRGINDSVRDLSPLLNSVGESFGKMTQNVNTATEAIGPLLEGVGQLDSFVQRTTGGTKGLWDMLRMGVPTVTELKDNIELLTIAWNEWADWAEGSPGRRVNVGSTEEKYREMLGITEKADAKLRESLEKVSAETLTAAQKQSVLKQAMASDLWKLTSSGAKEAAHEMLTASDATAKMAGQQSKASKSAAEVAAELAAISDELDNEKADKFSESVAKMEGGLRESIATFGMSADELDLWKLKQEQAGTATTETIEALQAELRAMKDAEAATDLFIKTFDRLDEKVAEFGKPDNQIELDFLESEGVGTGLIKTMQLWSDLQDELDSVRKSSEKASEQLASDLADYEAELRKTIATQGMSADEVKRWELAQNGATQEQLSAIEALQKEAGAIDEVTDAMNRNSVTMKFGERDTMEALAKAREAQIRKRFDDMGPLADGSKMLAVSLPTFTATVDLDFSASLEEFKDSLNATAGIRSDIVVGDIADALASPRAAETQQTAFADAIAQAPPITITPQSPLIQPVVNQPDNDELKKQTKWIQQTAKNTAKPPVKIVVEEVTL